MKIVLGLMVLVFIIVITYSLTAILLLLVKESVEAGGYEARIIEKLIAVFFKRKGDKDGI